MRRLFSQLLHNQAQRRLPGTRRRATSSFKSIRVILRTMQAGFYTIMAAQFFSSLADNALLVAAIQLLRDLESPAWMTPSLKQVFVFSYVLLAPLVGAFADSMPKGRVMLITNGVKIVGCSLMLFMVHPLLAYALVGLGAAATLDTVGGSLSTVIETQAPAVLNKLVLPASSLPRISGKTSQLPWPSLPQVTPCDLQ